MSRQNRVDPEGGLIEASARGTLMGNRGCLHDDSETSFVSRRAMPG